MFETRIAETSFFSFVEAFRKDPWFDMPSILRRDPEECFRAKKIVLCGSQLLGEIRFLATHLDVVAIVDDSRSDQRSSVFDIEVIDSSTWIRLTKTESDVISIICSASVLQFNHFSRCCAQHGIANISIIQAHRLLERQGVAVVGAGSSFIYGLNYFHHAVKNAENFRETATALVDDYSRFTLYSLLTYRLVADPNTLALCGVGHCSDQYSFNSYLFDRSFLDFGDREVFVDGGSFDGDSLQGFVCAVRGRFKYAYCFEPNEELAELCRGRVQKLQAEYLGPIMDRVSVVPKGLWSSETTLRFNPGLYAGFERVVANNSNVAGHIVKNSFVQHLFDERDECDDGVDVSTTTVDDACDPGVTFIKLEVEGSEMEALAGAKTTISRDRPRMALAVYHKPDDLLAIPKFVNETSLDYRMSLRQHNPLVPDATVCYCY